QQDDLDDAYALHGNLQANSTAATMSRPASYVHVGRAAPSVMVVGRGNDGWRTTSGGGEARQGAGSHVRRGRLVGGDGPAGRAWLRGSRQHVAVLARRQAVGRLRPVLQPRRGLRRSAGSRRDRYTVLPIGFP